jgi:hypothetical protein
LALDRAGLGQRSPELGAHLERCAECREYVESLAQPPAASGFIQIQARLRARRRAARFGVFTLFPITAAAAGLFVFLSLNPQADFPRGHAGPEPYLGTKGFTSVWIYVKRGATSELWDGKSPIVAGDRLRIKVDPGKFAHVEVYSVKDPTAPARLYAGSVVPGQSVTLPDAWEVDSEPGSERLVVAFSNDVVEAAWPDWLRGKAGPGLVVLPFVLPKTAGTELDSGLIGP